jgi:uncharacterized protein YecE (DUF72 family)
VPLFVGTSGFSYPEWKGAFYPQGLPARRFLEHYSRELAACEINATFYRLQSPDALRRWVETVPADFRFALKAYRPVTYRKQVGGETERARLGEFLESVAPLGARLACIRLQFPAFAERDDAGLARLLERLPAELPFTCELMHESWRASGVEDAVAARGGTVCLTDSDGPAPAALPPGPVAYVRLRAERYAEHERAAWLDLLRGEAERRDVYVFTKHKGVAADDPFAGLGLARWLSAQAGLRNAGARG